MSSRPPLVPEDLARNARDARSNNVRSFMRAAAAHAVAGFAGGASLPLQVAARLWPGDRGVGETLTRAASASAMTTTTGWAAELGHSVIADLLTQLGRASAAAALIDLALKLSFDG